MTIWEETFSKRSWGQYPPEPLIREVKKLHSQQQEASSTLRCLELGCGPGANAVFLAENFDTYTAIDISPTAIQIAQERLIKHNLQGTFYCGSFKSMPVPSHSFDFIVDNLSIYANSMEVIEATLCETARVIHPSGKFFSRVWGSATYGLNSGIEIEKNTFDNLQDGPCAGLGVSHFFDYEELISLYSNHFRISGCVQSLCRDMLSYNLVEEFILLCQAK